MKFTASPFDPIIPDTAPRSSGLHLGAVIKDMLLTLNKSKFGGAITPATRLLWEAGFLWEEALSKVLAARVLRQLDRDHVLSQFEIHYEGLYMTPDGFNLTTNRLEEYKFTRYSANHEFDSSTFRHWHWQAMAYCSAWETNAADFYVLFINGDYTRGPSSGPIGRHYAVEYSSAELSDNMRMILNHADSMR
jgi:hypothetical protein